MLAFFLANLSMSSDGAKELSKAAAELSIMSNKRKSKEPTADHLIAEEKAKQNGNAPYEESVGSSADPKAGSFEKLTAIFGGRMILPPKPKE